VCSSIEQLQGCVRTDRPAEPCWYHGRDGPTIKGGGAKWLRKAEYDRASGEYSQRSSGGAVLFWRQSLRATLLLGSWDQDIRLWCVSPILAEKREEVVHEVAP
jgi:hypothetical protein